MKAIVLVKQTPDTAKLSASMDGLKLMAEGGPRIVNPWDEYALEVGLALKDEHGGETVILTMGKPEATEAIKTGLAMGCNSATLLTDPAFENSDSLATARILAAAVNKLGDYDIILAGASAIDGGTAHTAVQVAALLGIPHLGYVAQVKEVDFSARTITVVRALEGGRETVTSPLPCVLSVLKEIGEPRYPSFMGIRKAAKAKIPQWSLSDLGLGADEVGAAGSGAQWPEVTLPPAIETTLELIEGEPEEAAKVLVDKLLAEKVI
ncbi:MAG: electron transfer flavoprotein subunit beta/FixA family protein [Caldilineae bacterium]|nr:MAG: electron transfer flavoprotein subunit beta/FixA family protein [Caldilineae bacterium]